ncbi:MAG: SLC13 family permease [Fibrobacterota bacterium]
MTEFAPWITAAVIIGLLIMLIRDRFSSSVIFLSALTILTLTGTVSAREAFSGFSNLSVITIGLLFYISDTLGRSPVIRGFLRRIFRRLSEDNYARTLPHLLIPAGAVSAVINNTPVVLLFTNYVKEWSREQDNTASLYLLPLSYAAVTGGMITLFGTSTNLIVHGLIIENTALPGLGIFELAAVGIPACAVTIIYAAVAGKYLLPRRASLLEEVHTQRKKYAVEFRVSTTCPLAGKTVKSGGLRNLNGVYLSAVERSNHLQETVSPDFRIAAGDRLIFTGETGNIGDLARIPGLDPVETDSFLRDFGDIEQHLVEVVIAPDFKDTGKTVKEIGFRERYKASVAAVHRNNEKIALRIGDIRLRRGDHLLLLTNRSFMKDWQDSRDFYILSTPFTLPEKDSSLREKATLAVFAGIIALAALSPFFRDHLPFTPGVTIFASLTAVLFAWINPRSVRGYSQKVPWNVLITIAASLGISKAIFNSGLASILSDLFMRIPLENAGLLGAVALIYVTTNIFTELITNNAAAAFMFPIALSYAQSSGTAPMPLFVTICIAASASFSSPYGYQTNLMVKEAGRYTFGDYLRFGLPLNILIFLISILIIPKVW